MCASQPSDGLDEPVLVLEHTPQSAGGCGSGCLPVLWLCTVPSAIVFFACFLCHGARTLPDLPAGCRILSAGFPLCVIAWTVYVIVFAGPPRRRASVCRIACACVFALPLTAFVLMGTFVETRAVGPAAGVESRPQGPATRARVEAGPHATSKAPSPNEKERVPPKVATSTVAEPPAKPSVGRVRPSLELVRSTTSLAFRVGLPADEQSQKVRDAARSGRGMRAHLDCEGSAQTPLGAAVLRESGPGPSLEVALGPVGDRAAERLMLRVFNARWQPGAVLVVSDAVHGAVLARYPYGPEAGKR